MTASISMPQGLYAAAMRHGDLVFTAGMTPRKEGRLLYDGPVSEGAAVEDYRAAAELACANALAAAQGHTQGDEQVIGILSMTVYIASGAGFARHSQIADFASRYLEDVIGPRGVGARVAVGVATLPGNASLEIQLVAALGRTRDLAP